MTWSIVHSPPHQAFTDQVPYATGYVELAEGPWLLGRLVGVDAGQLAVGATFEVRFVRPDDGESYPVLVPVTP